RHRRRAGLVRIRVDGIRRDGADPRDGRRRATRGAIQLEPEAVAEQWMILGEERVDSDVAVRVALPSDRRTLDITVAVRPDTHRVPLGEGAVAAQSAHGDADEG